METRLTLSPKSAKPARNKVKSGIGQGRMGRRKEYDDTLFVRCSTETKQLIAALAKPGEKEADFVRYAVEQEIKRRLRERKRLGLPLPTLDEPSC